MFYIKRILGLGILLAVAVSGCTWLGRPQTPQNNPAPTIPERVSKELLNFFPQQVRTRWNYRGTGGYTQSVYLQRNTYTQRRDRLVQRFVGEVGPAPGGKTVPLILERVTTSREVRERIIQSSPPFTQRLTDLVLLRLPVSEGAAWSQTIRLQGEIRTLQAQITAVDPLRTGNVKVTVRYRVPMTGKPNGFYEETREFESGKGLTRFETNEGFGYAIVQLNFPDQPRIYDRIKQPKVP